MRQVVAIDLRWLIFLLLSSAISVILPPRIVHAEEAPQKIVRAAHISSMHGSVDIKRINDTNWIPAEKGMRLFEGDRLRTGLQSSADFFIEGGEPSEVRLVENTELTFDHLVFNDSSQTSDTLLDLTVGKIFVASEDLTEGSKYNVRTPTSLVGIRGTMFEVEVS